MKINELTSEIIGAGIEVHRHIGPGLLESVYEECMSFELMERGLEIERQQKIPVIYKGKKPNMDFRIDILVNQLVIVELKSVQKLEKIHEAQLLTYLKLTNKRLGLLMNFNVPVMKNGIRRLING